MLESESISYSDFKPIRNKIRKFDADKLLELEIRMMHELQDAPREKLSQCPPWLLMSLIKWTLMYGEMNSTKQAPTRNDLAVLINMTHKLGHRARLPSDYSNVGLFMKSLAFQQFWYQNLLASSDIGRQIALFLEILPPTFVKEIFHDKLKLAPEDFFELAFALATRFQDKKHTIYIDTTYFEPLKKIYPEETINRFLDRLSYDLESVKKFLKSEDERIKDFDARLYEQTPLRKRPLLKLGSSYICYSPDVLLGGLSTLAYDIFKEEVGERFTQKFGEAFEKYIRQGLAYSKLNFLSERELERDHPGQKMVDFLVPLPGTHVFVESKAIEMSPLAQVSPDARVVTKSLRNSVIKAIKQALIAIKCLDNKPIQSDPIKENFLLIVTFKSLFIGNGNDFVAGEVRNEIENFTKTERIEPQRLPPENIYFLSVREFEWLTEICKNNQDSLLPIIKDMIETDRNPSTRKFLVEQHLVDQRNRGKYKSFGAPDYATEPFNRMTSRLVSRLSESTKSR